jgi:hypothetical protein
MDWKSTDDGDEAFFEWALAYFREHPVIFSILPASGTPDDAEDAATRRKRLDRMN